jgi:hypothetical protein
MRFAALDNKLDNIDRHVENLRLDMQSAIHNEFMYLANKMLLLPKQQQQKKHNSDNSTDSVLDIIGLPFVNTLSCMRNLPDKKGEPVT